jgi:hypothetical protein
VIENVSGIRIIARKAGNAISSSSQLIFVTGAIINRPTMTRIGAVVNTGNIERRGAKKRKGRKKRPAKTEDNPVRAPC